MIPVKICGITNLEDALTCCRLGAAAIGFIFADSKRKVTPEMVYQITRNISPFILKVGVFVNENPLIIKEIMKDCRLDLAQLHGSESPDDGEVLEGRVIKVFRAGYDRIEVKWKTAPIRAVLVDTYSPRDAGGTGTSFDWSMYPDYKTLGFPTILAGGLNDLNIGAAVKIAGPDGVDISSGVEREPGIKDPRKVSRLFREISKIS